MGCLRLGGLLLATLCKKPNAPGGKEIEKYTFPPQILVMAHFSFSRPVFPTPYTLLCPCLRLGVSCGTWKIVLLPLHRSQQPYSEERKPESLANALGGRRKIALVSSRLLQHLETTVSTTEYSPARNNFTLSFDKYGNKAEQSTRIRAAKIRAQNEVYRATQISDTR